MAPRSVPVCGVRAEAVGGGGTSPRLARLAPYLFSSLLSFFLPSTVSLLVISPSSEAGEVNVREVRAILVRTRAARSKGSRMRSEQRCRRTNPRRPQPISQQWRRQCKQKPPRDVVKTNFLPEKPGITIGLRTFCFRVPPPAPGGSCEMFHVTPISPQPVFAIGRQKGVGEYQHGNQQW